MMSEEDFTRQANDPAIRAAVRRIRERYPASYFGQIDVEELVWVAIWEARAVLNRRTDELRAKLAQVTEAVEESGDESLKQRVREIAGG